jgi:hypothetical protein
MEGADTIALREQRGPLGVSTTRELFEPWRTLIGSLFASPLARAFSLSRLHSAGGSRLVRPQGSG